MNTSRKWMLSLSDEHYDWIHATAEEVEMPGSAIITELIDQCIKTNAQQFKEKLIAARARIELRSLQDKKLTLEEQINALKAKVNGVKVPA